MKCLFLFLMPDQKTPKNPIFLQKNPKNPSKIAVPFFDFDQFPGVPPGNRIFAPFLGHFDPLQRGVVDPPFLGHFLVKIGTKSLKNGQN